MVLHARSVDYAASLAADAQQRAARFERAATAQAPYASDAGMLTRMGSTSSTSSMGQFHLPGQQAPLPASKVRSGGACPARMSDDAGMSHRCG